MPHSDYFIPSIEEARDLSGLQTVEDNAQYFIDQRVGCCALTMRAEGSLIAKGIDRIRIVPHAIEVVGTTDCGDAYSAGFIAGLAAGCDLEEYKPRLGHACHS